MKYLFSEYGFQKEATLFRRLLYGFMIVKCFYWLADFDLLFGPESIVHKNSIHLSFIKSTAFLLFNSDSAFMSYAALIGGIVLSLYAFFFKSFSRLVAFTVWFLLVNIDNKIYPTLTGGDFLFQQLLFFNIFLSNFSLGKTEIGNELDKAIHNTGVAAIKIQICIVYFVAGLAKLMDADWQNGMALIQTFMINDFSLPFYYNNVEGSSVILKMMNYFIIAYQVSFPILIWIKKTKKQFLAFGVLQHLFIALVMGLPSFGFIMIIAYSIFYAPAFKFKNSL